MQAPLNDPKIQVGSLPDIENELTKTAASMQKMKTELADLRALVRVQDASLISLRQALADRDASIAALSAGEKRLREDLEAMARTDTAPAMAEIKDELREYVQQQVPLAAAKIIREEIATLIKELEG
jgi:N-methylhydantoinase B/oxoprolinase/acetone carboxylase alpha subunit